MRIASIDASSAVARMSVIERTLGSCRGLVARCVRRGSIHERTRVRNSSSGRGVTGMEASQSTNKFTVDDLSRNGRVRYPPARKRRRTYRVSDPRDAPDRQPSRRLRRSLAAALRSRIRDVGDRARSRVVRASPFSSRSPTFSCSQKPRPYTRSTELTPAKRLRNVSVTFDVAEILATPR